MVEGTIIKGIGGFYYVKTQTDIYECKARGLFREKNITPIIGDRVLIQVNEIDNTGSIQKILARKSQLIRPPVANITQALIVMSIKEPDINCWLLDRFIVMAEHQNLDVVICINKIDLGLEEELHGICEIYKKAGYPIVKTSVQNGVGIDLLGEALKNNTTVLAGPSGVGKSSLLNKICPVLELETGDISQKTSRGKHTTRHVELINLGLESYVLDTPGFSSLDLSFIQSAEQLSKYFKEMRIYLGKCQFTDCLHHNEPNCEIKRQVSKGMISKERYDNYLCFLNEFIDYKRY